MEYLEIQINEEQALAYQGCVEDYISVQIQTYLPEMYKIVRIIHQEFYLRSATFKFEITRLMDGNQYLLF